MDYTREEAAQLARLHKAMSAPIAPTPEAEPDSSEFLEFMSDLYSAGKTLAIWLAVVLFCLLAAVAVTLGA